jgi:hypothetical protein
VLKERWSGTPRSVNKRRRFKNQEHTDFPSHRGLRDDLIQELEELLISSVVSISFFEQLFSGLGGKAEP